MEEVQIKRKAAQEAYENKNFEESVRIYKEIIDEVGFKDQLLLANYGQALRKNNQSLEFIEICREYVKTKRITLNILQNTLCWCIYEEYIKKYDENNGDNFEEFLKEAHYICDNLVQLEAEEYYKNPYVRTVMKVIRVFNNKSNVNYKKILEWLELLNPIMLSEEIFKFKDENGVEREIASPKEFYYQNKIKSLEKTFQYTECYNLCEECLIAIKKFHYGNKLWIESRKLFCKCMTDSNYIEQYIVFAETHRVWHIYKKLSDICFRFGKIEKALIYGSKAIICSFEYEKMINLYLSMGQLFERLGDVINAKAMYQASGYYRQIYGWKMPEELEYQIYTYNLDLTIKPNKRNLQDIAYECLRENKLIKTGKIVKMIKNNNAGFINISPEESDMYFNVNEAKTKHLHKGMLVEFEIIQTVEKPNAVVIRKIERRDENGSIYEPKRH